MLHRLASPAVFQRLSTRVLPWLAAAALLATTAGLYLAFFASPPDYQQGETVRIMYIHVPAAWLSVGGYSFIALASLGSLVWKHPLADIAARSAAPVGAAFTALCLLTGMLWGKPMWGAWWVWDARLTSVLVLFFLYLGYMALAAEAHERGSHVPHAVLALVGWVNVPIIKFSVEWWNTLHQPASLLRRGGPSIHPSMLHPLLTMMLAATLWFAVLVILRMQTELLRQRTARLTQRMLDNAAKAG